MSPHTQCVPCFQKVALSAPGCPLKAIRALQDCIHCESEFCLVFFFIIILF